MTLQQKIEFDIMVKINDLTDRLERVQYALYHTENPDNRFEKIYDQLASLESSRKLDRVAQTDQSKYIDQQLKDTLFEIDGRMRELDVYKQKYESMGNEIQETCDHMKQFMDAQSKKISTYFSDQDAKLIKLDDRLSVLEG